MFIRKPGIELDILDNNRTQGQEEDEYINESLEEMHKVFGLLEKQIKKIFEFRIKNIHFLTKIN